MPGFHKITALFAGLSAMVTLSAAAQISMGNGSDNWIMLDGASRDGTTLTIPEVKIDGNGWLVLHPFEDGKPNGKIYVGHTYVPNGVSRQVEVTVDRPVKTGDMFIVMLHRDVNENQDFDFVFIEENKVIDEAVFEGTVMIGHAYPAP